MNAFDYNNYLKNNPLLKEEASIEEAKSRPANPDTVAEVESYVGAYLYGEYKILGVKNIEEFDDPYAKDPQEGFTAILAKGKEVDLFRDINTSEWYDSDSNEARIKRKKNVYRPMGPMGGYD